MFVLFVSGNYMYVEGGLSTAHPVNSRAIIYSQDLANADAPTPKCLTFSYLMTAAGAAVVRVHQVERPQDSNPLWEHYGRTDAAGVSNTWGLAKVPLEFDATEQTQSIVSANAASRIFNRPTE